MAGHIKNCETSIVEAIVMVFSQSPLKVLDEEPSMSAGIVARPGLQRFGHVISVGATEARPVSINKIYELRGDAGETNLKPH
jgi:hypothetical protein